MVVTCKFLFSLSHHLLISLSHDLLSFVGSKAEEHRGALLLSYPMENGIVKNWNDMERIWSYIYSRDGLNCSGGEHAVSFFVVCLFLLFLSFVSSPFCLIVFLLNFNSLQLSFEQVLLTESPLNPISNREKAAEIFFEGFTAPALFFAPQAILSLYASGRTTGLVLDSGSTLSTLSSHFFH